MDKQKESKKMTVTIFDAQPFVEHELCPSCGEFGSIIEETDGPLADWHLCQICENWFSPLVEFVNVRKDDDY